MQVSNKRARELICPDSGLHRPAQHARSAIQNVNIPATHDGYRGTAPLRARVRRACAEKDHVNVLSHGRKRHERENRRRHAFAYTGDVNPAAPESVYTCE